MSGTNRNIGLHRRAETLPQAVLKAHFTDCNCTALVMLKVLWLKLLLRAKSYNFISTTT